MGETGTDVCPDASLLQVVQSRTSEAAAWHSREFHLVPHHKTGTVMTHEAAENMLRAGFQLSSAPLPTGVSEEDVVEAAFSDTLEDLVRPSDLPIPWIEASMHGMGMATDLSMMQTASPKCIAHIVRNPFEVVVSGYMYHMGGSEAWTGLSFSDADTSCNWKWFSPIVEEVSQQADDCYGSYCKSVGQVMHNSISGEASSWLPDVDPAETYSEYLSRVNLTAGLIAESLWAVNSSLAPMRFVYDYTEGTTCSTNICLSKFYDDCESAWRHVLHTWEIPEPQFAALLTGAMKSCPRTSERAKQHSSADIAKSSDIAHPPEHEMMAVVRKMDRLLFNGRMAALEEHLGCSARGKYNSE